MSAANLVFMGLYAAFGIALLVLLMQSTDSKPGRPTIAIACAAVLGVASVVGLLLGE
jgi:hypothetical protein